MRASPLVGALGALTISAAAAHHAYACSCAPSEFYADFAASHAVFIGEVLEISSPGSEYPPLVSVTLRIETAWKGAAASSTTRVVTASSEAACGFPFRVGARYLVYSYRPGVAPASDELWATLCTRTHETSPRDPDLELLSSPLRNLTFTVSPNPSLGWTRLTWTIVGDPGQQAHARLEVLDSQGRRIRALVDGPAAVGPHVTYWDGRNERGDLAPRGIYWVRLRYGDQVTARRLVRLAAGP